MKLAGRVSKVKPSETLAITAKANVLRAQGRDVIGFGAGEPDFNTPDHIKKAAIQAIEAGFTKYTPVSGTDELKDAIISKLKVDNNLEYKRSQIAVSCGAKHSLYNLAQVLFEEGDEVIIPAPYWVSYPDMVVLAGGSQVILNTLEKDGFKMQPGQLKSAITGRTKAVILNGPSNPTGSAYSPDDLKSLASVLADTDIFTISDDIYEKILYTDYSFANFATVDQRFKNRTIVVNGVSKAYAMTGWCIGYAAGPEEIIGAIGKIQGQSTSNPSSISQKSTRGGAQWRPERGSDDGRGIQKKKGLYCRGAKRHSGNNLPDVRRGFLRPSQCIRNVRPFLFGKENNEFDGLH